MIEKRLVYVLDVIEDLICYRVKIMEQTVQI
jgi:hypothetical protein